MIGLGWFLSIIGTILSGIGYIWENSATNADYGLGAWTRADEIENAQLCLTVGIFILIGGVIFLIVGYIRRSIEVREYLESRARNRQREVPPEEGKDTSLLNTKRCTNCGFVGGKDDLFCQVCGKKFK